VRIIIGDLIANKMRECPHARSEFHDAFTHVGHAPHGYMV